MFIGGNPNLAKVIESYQNAAIAFCGIYFLWKTEHTYSNNF